VTSVVGVRLIETWNGSATSHIMLPPPPDLDIPPPDHAFDDEGKPIAAVHLNHGGDVRGALLWEADERRRRWIPNGPVGIDQGPQRLQPYDELSIDDWERAYEAVVLPRELRSGARQSLERVANAIAEMALLDDDDERSITLIGRPVLGGPPVTIDRSVWTTGTELRMRRLAACGLNVDAPFDPAASVTHLVFVDANGLNKALDAYAPDNTFLAIDDVAEWWPTTEPPNRKWTQDANDRVRKALTAEMVKPENRYWRVPQAQRYIATLDGFGNGYDAIVARVCGEMKKENLPAGVFYGSLGFSGRPRLGLRLVRDR
jgi:hypothetical protein